MKILTKSEKSYEFASELKITQTDLIVDDTVLNSYNCLPGLASDAFFAVLFYSVKIKTLSPFQNVF